MWTGLYWSIICVPHLTTPGWHPCLRHRQWMTWLCLFIIKQVQLLKKTHFDFTLQNKFGRLLLTALTWNKYIVYVTFSHDNFISVNIFRIDLFFHMLKSNFLKSLFLKAVWEADLEQLCHVCTVSVILLLLLVSALLYKGLPFPHYCVIDFGLKWQLTQCQFTGR